MSAIMLLAEIFSSTFVLDEVDISHGNLKYKMAITAKNIIKINKKSFKDKLFLGLLECLACECLELSLNLFALYCFK